MSNGAATNSILLTFVQGITTVLGFIITKLLSVHFSLQDYGTYSQALLVTTTVTSISILGLTNATNFFYNRTKDEKAQRIYVATIFTIQYIVGLACAILVFALRVPISRYFGNETLIRSTPNCCPNTIVYEPYSDVSDAVCINRKSEGDRCSKLNSISYTTLCCCNCMLYSEQYYYGSCCNSLHGYSTSRLFLYII